jgi:cellulose synthase operon protein YhjU
MTAMGTPEKPASTDSPAAARLSFGRAADRLGPWSFYFIAKLLLLWRGLIAFHPVENLVFLAMLAGPLASPRWKRLRPWIGTPVAIALLYYDSYLPKASRVLSQASLVSGFSADYLAELAGRFVSVPVIALLAAAAVAFFALSRFVRTDALALAGALAVSPFQPPFSSPPAPVAASPGAGPAASSATPDAALAAFRAAEARRRVEFTAPPAGDTAFDVIFIHVCSLSWDDLEATGLAGHPLLKGFDLLMRRFNTVSAYSGPSAIRLLRGSCGQPSHRDLYAPPAEGCLLMPALEKAGLKAELALNHDGHFDDFLKTVRAQGVPADPLPLDGLPAPLRSFDDSRIYGDFAVLDRWLSRRAKEPAARVAAYYNTITLHDGNRSPGQGGSASLETYRARLSTLLDDLERFIAKLDGSGRRAVVVVIPEHGAALRGEPGQIAGLREIPSPAITLVPVGIRVTGAGARRQGEPFATDAPVSYLALSSILQRMLAKSPYAAPGFRAADYAEGLPETAFVAEGETVTVIRQGDKVLVRQDAEPWRALPAAAPR